MTNDKTNPKVDEWINKEMRWKEEFKELREILHECVLTEEIKWNKPCYTSEGRNIAIIQGFKEYCALMFFKGSLLDDTEAILTSPGENSQAQRQLRFTTLKEIIERKSILKTYIQEAINIEKAGLEVTYKETSAYNLPEELQIKFDENPNLKVAFEQLTPGRQRQYILYVSKAKQSKTRESRVEKYMQHILDGKGLNDE
ncbi:hypothetical protein FZW96_14005 [Bacillus sp. BGMRC 2118]|nr:hypothetical protein FZW96_14005 [Bacillus sp. BGMRC 2118]